MSWKEVSLIEIAAKSKYPIGDGDHGAIKPAQYQSSGIPYIRVADMDWNGEIFEDNMAFISEEINYSNPKSHLFPGDIIISKTGATIGKVAIIPDRFKIANTTASIGKVTIDKTQADVRYVFWAMKSTDFQKEMWKVSHKSAQPGFNVYDLKKFQIPLPPLATQKRIADILDAADALRRKDKELLKKYDELAQAIFIDMFGDPVKNEKGWEVKKLDQVVEFPSGLVNPRVLPYSNMYHVGGDNIESSTGKIFGLKKTNELALKSGKFHFTNEHILYNKIRPKLNKVARPSFEGICSADMYPLLPKEKFILKDYLYFILKSETFLDFADKQSRRANIPKINMKEMSEFEFQIPPMTIQIEFMKRITYADEILAISSESFNKSSNLFQSLIQKAFKGELVA
jgi:type I restriction enzyme S subunit